jgi:hypothetical protein
MRLSPATSVPITETVIAGCAQAGHISLSKTLVAALEVVGEFYELDLALAQRVDDRLGNGAERLGAAGAAIEDAARASLPQPQIDVGDIADMNEIAALFARAKTVIGAEQLWVLASPDLVEQMEGDRGHSALVRLARAINIEVAQARHRRMIGVENGSPDIVVEQFLRIGIDVERPLERRVLAKLGAAAIDGGRGGVEEGDPQRQAGMQQPLRIGVVHLHHVLAVPLGGGRAGALMEDGLDAAEIAGLDARQELVLVEIVGDLVIGQIGDLAAIGEVIDDDYVVMAFGIERGDDVGADHAGAARDDDHEGLWLLAIPVLIREPNRAVDEAGGCLLLLCQACLFCLFCLLCAKRSLR